MVSKSFSPFSLIRLLCFQISPKMNMSRKNYEIIKDRNSKNLKNVFKQILQLFFLFFNYYFCHLKNYFLHYP